MRALVIVHDPGSLPTLVGARLEHHGFTLDPFRVATFEDTVCHRAFPDPLDYDLILPMGAVWSVDDEARLGSWIGRELDLLRRADAAGVPVLGVCFGGQAIAAALGGRVERAPVPQVGWYHVESDVPDAIAPGPWMQWHYDRFVPPPGAVDLARDEVGVQAFRVRRNLGLQFHPEVDLDHVRMWLAADEHQDEDQLAGRGISVAELVAETERCWPEAAVHTDALVDWFLAEVATAPVGAGATRPA